MDESGRVVDEFGNVLAEGKGPVATTKANQRKAEAAASAAAEERNPYLQAAAAVAAEGTGVVDSRIKATTRASRGKRALQFIKPGRFVKEAEEQRAREARRAISDSVRVLKEGGGGDSTAAAAGGSGKADLSSTAAAGVVPQSSKRARARLPAPREDPIPQIEWWDAMFLPKEERGKAMPTGPAADPAFMPSFANLSLKHSRTAAYIELPVPREPYTEPKGPDALPLVLTKKEAKRQRRKARAERFAEERDLVKAGLKPAPKGKIKLSNMMKVLAKEAVLTPTEVERRVREQILERKQAHENRNEAGKLMPSERREKAKRKFAVRDSDETTVALFRVADLSDRRNKYKLDMNARQMQVTGKVVICKPRRCCLIYIEGSALAVRKFTRLVMLRIKWDQYQEDIDAEDKGETPAPRLPNPVFLVWKGVVQKRAFSDFRFAEANEPEEAKRVLETRGLGHHWDAVQRFDPTVDKGLDVEAE